jgi:hypothetical protein
VRQNENGNDRKEKCETLKLVQKNVDMREQLKGGNTLGLEAGGRKRIKERSYSFSLVPCSVANSLVKKVGIAQSV